MRRTPIPLTQTQRHRPPRQDEITIQQLGPLPSDPILYHQTCARSSADRSRPTRPTVCNQVRSRCGSTAAPLPPPRCRSWWPIRAMPGTTGSATAEATAHDHRPPIDDPPPRRRHTIPATRWCGGVPKELPHPQNGVCETFSMITVHRISRRVDDGSRRTGIPPSSKIAGSRHRALREPPTELIQEPPTAATRQPDHTAHRPPPTGVPEHSAVSYWHQRGPSAPEHPPSHHRRHADTKKAPTRCEPPGQGLDHWCAARDSNPEPAD